VRKKKSRNWRQTVPKQTKSPLTPHCFWICKKNDRCHIEIQQRNSRSEHGRSNTGTLAIRVGQNWSFWVLRTAKKRKNPQTPYTLFEFAKKKLGAPCRNATAKFKMRTKPFERGHPRYQSRPKLVTLSVANSNKKWNRPTSLYLKECVYI